MNGTIDSVFMFKKLTDSQWNTIQPHRPKHATTRRPKSDDRTTINAILFVLITGWYVFRSCLEYTLPNRII